MRLHVFNSAVIANSKLDFSDFRCPSTSWCTCRLHLVWLTHSSSHTLYNNNNKNAAFSWSVRNIPKFKDRDNWSRDTFQPMRRRACVYQQTNQNIAPVIKNFQNNGWSPTESVIVSRFSGIFLRLFMRHTKFF